jgi:hypothetical protein
MPHEFGQFRSPISGFGINQGKLYGLSSRLTPEAREKLIQAEIGCLPNQDWTELFKEAGCTNLPSAPAGRPPKKKKKT